MSKKPTSKSNPSGAGPNLVQLEKLFKLMGEYQMGEIDWENEDERIHVRTQGMHGGAQHPINVHQAMPAQMMAPLSGQAEPSKPAEAKLADNIKQVPSPFVGTFYRSASPGKDPYVREGTMVKRGDVLCIIEAMKLMNEIDSEFQGKIVSILVENGQPVEFGEPLFTIETT